MVVGGGGCVCEIRERGRGYPMIVVSGRRSVAWVCVLVQRWQGMFVRET